MRKLISLLDYKIKEFIEEWEDGSSRTFDISLIELKRIKQLNEYELDQIITNIKHIEEIKAGDDGNLLITIDYATLKACYEAQLQDWVNYSDIKQFGRYERF